MAISFVNAGTEASATSGGITLNAPSSPVTNDVWIAVIHSSDQVAHTLTDWTQIAQGNGGGTTSRLSVWYFRYAGSNPNLTVGHTAGASIIGGIASYRGCKTSGSPVDTAGSISGGTDSSIEHAAINPTQANCALLVCNGAADDNNRTALGGDYVVVFEDTGGGTQNAFVDSAGTPDASVSLFHDILIPDADTGTVTVTQAAADPWTSVLVALAPNLSQTITATAPTVTITAPAVTRVATRTMSATAPVVTFSAPTAVRVAVRSLVAGAPTVVLSAPTAVRVATRTFVATAPTVTFSAPSAGIEVSGGNITFVLNAPMVTFSAPSVVRVATVSMQAASPTVTLSAPLATLLAGGTTLGLTAPTVNFSAPAAMLLTQQVGGSGGWMVPVLESLKKWNPLMNRR